MNKLNLVTKAELEMTLRRAKQYADEHGGGGSCEECEEQLEASRQATIATNAAQSTTLVDGEPLLIDAKTCGTTHLRVRLAFDGFSDYPAHSTGFIAGTRKAASTDGFCFYVNQRGADNYELRTDYGTISNVRATGLSVGQFYTVDYTADETNMNITITTDDGTVVWSTSTPVQQFTEDGQYFGLGSIADHTGAISSTTAVIRFSYLEIVSGEERVTAPGAIAASTSGPSPLSSRYLVIPDHTGDFSTFFMNFEFTSFPTRETFLCGCQEVNVQLEGAGTNRGYKVNFFGTNVDRTTSNIFADTTGLWTLSLGFATDVYVVNWFRNGALVDSRTVPSAAKQQFTGHFAVNGCSRQYEPSFWNNGILLHSASLDGQSVVPAGVSAWNSATAATLPLRASATTKRTGLWYEIFGRYVGEGFGYSKLKDDSWEFCFSVNDDPQSWTPSEGGYEDILLISSVPLLIDVALTVTAWHDETGLRVSLSSKLSNETWISDVIAKQNTYIKVRHAAGSDQIKVLLGSTELYSYTITTMMNKQITRVYMRDVLSTRYYHNSAGGGGAYACSGGYFDPRTGELSKLDEDLNNE